jgi:alkylhydroperoxidase family enzyme
MVALEANTVDASDHAALREAGFTEDEIWDIGAIAAFFSMSNRLANSTGLRANREFYDMGRTVPPPKG